MGVARIYRAATPYNGSQVSDLVYEQTTDTMYLAHIDHAPGKLVREDHADWLFSSITFGPSISAPADVAATATVTNTDTANSGANYFPQPATYVVTAVNDETGQESRASTSSVATNDLTLKKNYNTITWDAVTGATRYNVYKANNEQFYGYIGTTDSLTFRDDNIGPALDQAPPRAENPFPSAGGFPSTVCLHEQRLLWARTRNLPNAIWASRVGVTQLENMDRARPAQADDAFSMAIVSSQVSAVNQLVSTTSLLALTTHATFTIDGDGNGGVLTGDSPPAARREIGRGATRLRALAIDNAVFHASAVGYAIRAIGYSFELDGNRSNDVTIYSPHFFEGFQIVDWAYAAEPRSIIWAVRSDGKLLAFTWEQEQAVWGWTLCETQGSYKSVCVINEQGEDRAYFLVEREVGGQPKRFVERMASHLSPNPANACWLDCAVSGAFEEPRNTFTGLSHLEGEVVSVQADGAVYSGLTVTNGAVSLPDGITARMVTIGLPYTVRVKTLPYRMMGDSGTNLGRRQQPGDVVLQLRHTSNIKAGIPGKLYPVKQAIGNAGSPLTPLDGLTAPLSMANRASDEIEVEIEQTLPCPFELLAIAMEPVIAE
jgi:hypothetical protein